MSTHNVQPQCAAQLAHLQSRQALVSLAGMPPSRCFTAGNRQAAEWSASDANLVDSMHVMHIVCVHACMSRSDSTLEDTSSAG